MIALPAPAAGRRAWVHGTIVAALTALTVGSAMRPHAPPRFDGAGYAVLGKALRDGRGYREIDHPDAPRHAHYPPGYPWALSMLWRLTGVSAEPARLFSWACTISASVLAWLWFRRLYLPEVAFRLGLALACNWAWVRAGGEIQSEPLYLLLSLAALLVATRAGRQGGVGPGLVLGLALAACILTRHMGVGLALAVGLDLLLRGRPATALASALVAALLVVPWVAWLADVRQNTQVELLARGGLDGRIAGNALFYLRRVPDQLTGPFVEVGTVFRSSRPVALTMTAWAVTASAVVGWGWLRCLRQARRRLAGLVPIVTMALLLVWPFTEAGRFLIPLVPVLLVGLVEGLAGLAATFGLTRRARRLGAAVALAISIPYTAYFLLTGRAGAQQQAHAGFDAACTWIAREGTRPGPLMTRQPGEAFWLTGRQALLPPGSADDPSAIDRTIEQYGVAYLLVDRERYAGAPENPLARYVARRPGQVERVWDRARDGSVSVYEVKGPAGPRR